MTRYAALRPGPKGERFRNKFNPRFGVSICNMSPRNWVSWREQDASLKPHLKSLSFMFSDVPVGFKYHFKTIWKFYKSERHQKRGLFLASLKFHWSNLLSILACEQQEVSYRGANLTQISVRSKKTCICKIPQGGQCHFSEKLKCVVVRTEFRMLTNLWWSKLKRSWTRNWATNKG